ncbi:hydroxylysine kinase-like isoform X2 [Hemitrygon akajei]|uniref:hydroxylysine kinase-like isoform X2 n=1 Tax=Hemitrygon akajei TaxID=2704970 RepID=UPI003BF94E5B
MSDLKNAVLIKPSLSEAQVVELVGQLYRLKVSEVQPLPSYDDQNFHIQVAETQVSGDHRRSYVLKVLNTTDSQDVDLVEVQTRVMMFLKQKGFPASTPIPTTDGRIMSLETINSGQEYKTHMVRLLTYLPGIPLQQIPADPPTFYKVGQTLAQINKVLKEFQHPKLKSLQRDSFLWKLTNIHQLKEYLYILKDSDRKVVEHIIQQILEKVLPNISNFHESSFTPACLTGTLDSTVTWKRCAKASPLERDLPLRSVPDNHCHPVHLYNRGLLQPRPHQYPSRKIRTLAVNPFPGCYI